MTHYMSTRRMTVAVETDSGIITVAPPVIAKFKGQHVDRLRGWMKAQGGFMEEILNKQENEQ